MKHFKTGVVCAIFFLSMWIISGILWMQAGFNYVPVERTEYYYFLESMGRTGLYMFFMFVFYIVGYLIGDEDARK